MPTCIDICFIHTHTHEVTNPCQPTPMSLFRVFTQSPIFELLRDSSFHRPDHFPLLQVTAWVLTSLPAQALAERGEAGPGHRHAEQQAGTQGTRAASLVLVHRPYMGWEPVLRRSSGAWLWLVLLQFPVIKACGISNLLETPADLPRVSQIRVLMEEIAEHVPQKALSSLVG